MTHIPHDDGWTPTTEEVLEVWQRAWRGYKHAEGKFSFERWLNGIRSAALLEASEAWRAQAMPTNSELSMEGGNGPFTDQGIMGYMEAEHVAYDWLRERAGELSGGGKDV